ncbi:sodium-dependent transporter [Endozoicomonas gorgoniicola]|uniref:Transporter n=1 Tax=Endozoicomonas gorgoniicola TaxID=1234144 RepID=A0ABT3N2D2_9GAMM|nr:sodium-dependent transporter [Endozoicomonas gorgoniicola]MCW7555781.1 sodium-dependent transporter [Endozoicomonas gorgoniicola]
MSTSEPENEIWESRLTFVLAASGAAIGLANLWRFPYIAIQYGGGAFILVYLLTVLFLSLPLMIAEVGLGRYSRSDPITAMASLARHAGSSRGWGSIGITGAAASLIMLSFYSVVGGWAIAYMFKSFSGTFAGMDATSICDYFDDMVSDPVALTVWHSVFMLATIIIVAFGIHKGLENSLKVMMPAMIVILLLMLVYAITETGQFGRTVAFMFRPDFSKLTIDGVIAATGQAFFTLGSGLCMMMTYGAYISKKNKILTTSLAVVGFDTAVAILAGLTIFPVVFAFGLEARSGPGLLFVSLTTALAQKTFGALLGGTIFILASIAALSSSISLMEPAVAWLQKGFSIKRFWAAGVVGFLVWLLGLGSVFSYNIWSGVDYQWFGKSFFDLMVYLTTSLMMPLNSLMIALFVGWKMGRNRMAGLLDMAGIPLNIWMFSIRIVAPLMIVFILLMSLGLYR